LESRRGEQRGGVDDSSAGRDDLSTTTMDGVGVKGHVEAAMVVSAAEPACFPNEKGKGKKVVGRNVHVVTSATHRLLGAGSFLRRPLESRDTAVLDFVETVRVAMSASAFPFERK